MDIGILTETLNAFIGAFSSGFERLGPAISGLLRILIGLDVTFFCLMLLFDIEQLKNGFRKLLVLSLWTYVIQDFEGHATSVVNSLIEAGLTAAGEGGADPLLLLDPSRILEGAFAATEPLLQNMPDVGILDVVDNLAVGLTYILIMMAFGALAANAFLAVVEYYMALAVAGILMPFGVLGPTRWLAMKPVSFLVASGIKLMVIAFVMAIIGDVLGNLRFEGEEPTLRELWTMVFAAGTVALLAWVAPQRLAAGFMAGAASLGGSDAMPFVAPIAGGALAAIAPAAAVSRQAGGWVGQRLDAAATALGGMYAAVRVGARTDADASSSAPGSSARTSPLSASARTSASIQPARRPELVPSPTSAMPPARARKEGDS